MGVTSERTRGPFGLLASAWLYDAVQDALGAHELRARFVREHVRPAPHARVLDVGCGTGALGLHLGACEYTGVDRSDAYLAVARTRVGPDARLCRADVAHPEALPAGSFDIVILSGLLHHLPDATAGGLLRATAARLAPGGRLVTLDPTVTGASHPVGRLLAACDRGRHVRSPEAYARLARQALDRVAVRVAHDLLRVPYSHAILDCERYP